MSHRILKPFLFVAFALSCAVASVADETNEPIKLWPGGTPGNEPTEEENEIVIDERIGQKVTKIVKPVITVYQPDESKRTGAAVVICPGGGYHILALDLEGTEVAKWLNEIGVTAVVLQYRVPRSKTKPYQTPPLQDAQRAVRYVRHHAEALQVDAKRIGILGFSAGGNLSALTATNFNEPSYEAVDDIDKVSCRPDFAVLIYPAYLHKKGTNAELADNVPVTGETPPTLMIHTDDDPITSLSSIAFYTALKAANVKSELHVYPSGGHGYGLRPSKHAVSQWPKVAERWMKSMSIIKE